MLVESKDDKLEALAKQKDERKKALTALFPEQKRHTDYDKIAEALKKAPPFKNPKVYKNEYDKNADVVIGLSIFLAEDEFSQLPDVDSATVFSMVKRMTESDRYNSHCLLKLQQKRPSSIKEVKSRAEWEPYIKEFDKFIKEGKTESWAKSKIGDKIENERNRINKEFAALGKKQPFEPREIKKTGKVTRKKYTPLILLKFEVE
jgi:hypothetical protein